MLHHADLAAWRETMEASPAETLITREERTLGPLTLTGLWLRPGAHLELQTTGAGTLLIAQGLLTLSVDDWRSSAASGQLFGVSAHSRLKLAAETDTPVFAVLTTLPR